MLRILLIALPLALTAKTFPVDGIVVAVDAATRTLLVSHREIARYMPAMVMPFHAENAAELTALHPGMRITFDLEVARGSSTARRIRPAGGPDVTLPSPPEKLAIGAALPEFELTDQHGATLRLEDLRGKVVAIDFIYTRCPAARRLPAPLRELRHAAAPLWRRRSTLSP